MKKLVIVTALLVGPALLYGQSQSGAQSGGLDPADIMKPLADQWTSYSGDLSGKRFSALKLVNTTTVKNLSLKWMTSLTTGCGPTGTPPAGAAAAPARLEPARCRSPSGRNGTAVHPKRNTVTLGAPAPPAYSLSFPPRISRCKHHQGAISMATTLEMWNKAKQDFEATATKKRPGMNVPRIAKFLTSYKSKTGITPLAKALDDALGASDKVWSKADADAKLKLSAKTRASYEDLKAKGKGYLDVLAKSIQTELEDGDGRGDMMRALENMRNSVEVMLKGAKVKVEQLEHQAAGAKSGKGQVEAIKDSILLSSPASLDKAIAGMKVMVRNVKAKPNLDVWMKEISGDPPTRWATTKLKDLGTSFKKHPAIERHVGADPMEFQKRLNVYGAGWDENWWKKELGDEKNHKSEILKHAQAIEKQIPNLEILSTRLKDAIKKGAAA